MSVPQMKEERPASMLRAMFASLGSLLGGKDKVRSKQETEPAAAAPATVEPEVTAEPSAPAEPAAVAEPEAVTVPEAAVVPTEPEIVAAEAPTDPGVVATEAAEPEVAEEAVVAEAVVVEEAVVVVIPETPEAPEVVAVVEVTEVVEVPADPEIVAAEAPTDPGIAPVAVTPAVPAAGGALPLANYDSLTVASLRARLRTLSAAQLRQLVEYEKAHAARADVIVMFERRIAKVLAEG